MCPEWEQPVLVGTGLLSRKGHVRPQHQASRQCLEETAIKYSMPVTASSLPAGACETERSQVVLFLCYIPAPLFGLVPEWLAPPSQFISILLIKDCIFFSLDHSIFPRLNVTSIFCDISNLTESCRKAGRRPQIKEGLQGALLLSSPWHAHPVKCCWQEGIHFLETLLERNYVLAPCSTLTLPNSPFATK